MKRSSLPRRAIEGGIRATRRTGCECDARKVPEVGVAGRWGVAVRYTRAHQLVAAGAIEGDRPFSSALVTFRNCLVSRTNGVDSPAKLIAFTSGPRPARLFPSAAWNGSPLIERRNDGCCHPARLDSRSIAGGVAQTSVPWGLSSASLRIETAFRVAPGVDVVSTLVLELS